MSIRQQIDIPQGGDLKRHLEALYTQLNRRVYVHPDPLAMLYAFKQKHDLEVVGMLASGLAFGKATHIMTSVGTVLQLLPDPAAMLRNLARKDLRSMLAGFKHRWTTGDEVADLLFGVVQLQNVYGSLEDCFIKGIDKNDRDVIPAIQSFVAELRSASGRESSSLLPCPSKGSACKRHNLFLRWMVRKDDVDLGIWKKVSPSLLLIPLDVHMHRICTALGLTSRKQADLKTTMEITEAFRKLTPEDPVRYDFSLSRLGIRDDMEYGLFKGLVVNTVDEEITDNTGQTIPA